VPIVDAFGSSHKTKMISLRSPASPFGLAARPYLLTTQNHAPARCALGAPLLFSMLVIVQPLKAKRCEKLSMTDQKTVVLVSHPGITHNTLAGVLASFACLTVLPAAGALSAVDMLRRAAPDAIVIDANLPQEETLALLKYIKLDRTRMRCVVLTTTTRSHRELKSAGADIVLLDNCSASQLEAAVCTP
jgi:CheY-like chemotaxis protein